MQHNVLYIKITVHKAYYYDALQMQAFKWNVSIYMINVYETRTDQNV